MAHNKVYAYCENYCQEETMTKEQIEDGLSGKASTSHTHTKSQITDFAHTHTKSEITDFAHDHDDRYYTESEMNTKLNTKVNVSSISVLTGSITVNGSGTTTKDISYPSGFTQSNCVVLSTMTTSGTGANSVYGYPKNSTLIDAPRVALTSSNMQLAVTNNSSSSTTLNYKIILMKVS